MEFLGPNVSSRTFQGLKNQGTKIHNFPRDVGTLLKILIKIEE